MTLQPRNLIAMLDLLRTSIQTKLVLAPLVFILLSSAVIGVTGGSLAELIDQADIALAFEQQATHLQELFRGTNESLLTEGESASLEIMETAISNLDDSHRTLIAKLEREDPRFPMLERVDARWKIIRASLTPFLTVNGVSADDDASMVRYGRLLVESDQLRHDTHSLAQQSRGIVKELALYTTLTVSASIAAALLAMLLLFRHLYRSIAVPINRLHGTILRVSDSNGDLERQIALTQLPEDKAGPEEVAQNEIQALSHAFRFMLAAIRDHMARRKCAAPSDISCPNGS